MCSTFHPLSQRGVGESKHPCELFKILFSKCFGEDVCNFLSHGIVSQMNCLGLYMISNQMVLCVDMFGSIMKPRILVQLDYKSIVNEKKSGIHLFLPQIFEYFHEPRNFLCCF